MAIFGQHHPELKGQRCIICNGSGAIFDFQHNQFVECSRCFGTGLENCSNACPVCYGSGKDVNSDFPHSANHHDKPISYCIHCNGSGLKPLVPVDVEKIKKSIADLENCYRFVER